MSTSTKKAPIDPKSKAELESQLTTYDMYHQLDEYMRQKKQEQEIKKRSLARKIEAQGPELLKEIEEKNIRVEEERIEMIEYIITNTQEDFGTLKELKEMEYGELKKIQARVVERKKPAWRKFLNIFR